MLYNRFVMKLFMKPLRLFFVGGVSTLVGMGIVSCRNETGENQEPKTAREMYERAKSLLQPNVEGASSDFAGALEWTKRAAEAGLLQAQTDLGALYMYGGHGVSRDMAEARKWFGRAMEQGSKEAGVFMGIMYSEGLGVEKDARKAVSYWRPAAEAGIAEAQYRLGHLLAQADDTAAEGMAWLRKATMDGAKSGIAAAACDLGNIYAKGRYGVAVDMKEAARWYAIAANAGDARAQCVYALMLMNGEGAAKDVGKGLTFLRLAAGQDYLPAMAQLVNFLRNLEDAPESLRKEAEAWAKRFDELQGSGEKAAR